MRSLRRPHSIAARQNSVRKCAVHDTANFLPRLVVNCQRMPCVARRTSTGLSFGRDSNELVANHRRTCRLFGIAFFSCVGRLDASPDIVRLVGEIGLEIGVVPHQNGTPWVTK
jgi:hypothetical protein